MDASRFERLAMSTQIGWQTRGGGYGAAGTSPTGSRREALRTLLGGASGLALAAAMPVIAEAALEEDWRLCTKCRGLVGGTAQRRCPAGDFHRLVTSTVYALYYGPESLANHEAGWRWCYQCGLLTYRVSGTCPLTGNAHAADSTTYHVEFNQPPDSGEVGGWRYCEKCKTLFRPKRRGARGRFGRCVAGGSHKSYPGFNYNVYKAP